MGEDHGRETSHDSGGGRGPHAAAARDTPDRIVAAITLDIDDITTA
jgi:hypothetical protein